MPLAIDRPRPPQPRRTDTAWILGVPIVLTLIYSLAPIETLRDFSTGSILLTVGLEVLIGFAVVLRLRRLGWFWRDLSRPFEARDIIRGLGVFVLAYLVYIAGYYLAWALGPSLGQSTDAVRLTGAVAWPAILVIALVNPLFEELLWLGYAVSGPGQRRLWLALAWSLAARVLIHAYQGPLAIFGIAPLGLWYFRYYWRTGRLWPIMVAHGLQDVVGLALIGHHSAG